MIKKVIELKNIYKSYITGDTKYTALKGINLDIHEGEMVAIMGPSGSGKSSLMNIIGILDDFDSGEYLFNNINIKSKTKNELADIRNRQIGFVFQNFNLLQRTNVYENVELPLLYRKELDYEKRDKIVKEAVAKVELSNKLYNKSNAISGGQIQRVAIARALATNPTILLADEPTGNLDTKTSVDVMKVFQKMNEEGRTIIVITHEVNIAEFCKRVITIKDGLIESDRKI